MFKRRYGALLMAAVLLVTLFPVMPVTAAALTYELHLTPDWVQSKTQNYFALENSMDAAGNPRPGSKIPTEVLQYMTKIEVYMPQFLVDGEEVEDQHGLVFVLGGHGNWWATATRKGEEIIPWVDGKVTVYASDFPMKPSDIFRHNEDEEGGYLAIIDGWWTAAWEELGITRVTITYDPTGGGEGDNPPVPVEVPEGSIIQDPGFYEEVLALIGKDEGHVIAPADVAWISDLELWWKDIRSLNGIEHFVALSSLYVGDNQLTELDVSKNVALTTLYVSGNPLTELDVSKNAALRVLNCGYNQLTQLDVSKNIALRELSVYGNQLTELDVSNNPRLGWLNCNGNQLAELDLSNNPELYWLDCADNQLTKLDVIKSVALNSLYCQDNRLTTLDISNNPKLGLLLCYGNNFNSIEDIIGLDEELTSIEFEEPDYSYPPNLDKASDWARDAIEEAADKGFVSYELFDNYQDPITRAEFCSMAVWWTEYAIGWEAMLAIYEEKLLEMGLDLDSFSFDSGFNPFVDVESYEYVILAAYILGITAGTSSNTFTPEGEITREQAATMLLNVSKLTGVDLENIPPSGFYDASEAASWALPGIDFCRAKGIMEGVGGNSFSPKTTFTREQAIVTFNKMEVHGGELNPQYAQIS